MRRCFSFGLQSFAVSGLPDAVPTGEYLEPFITPVSARVDVEIRLTPRRTAIPPDAEDDQERYYFSVQGRQYLSVRYTRIRDAAVFAPGDWKNEEIEIEWNPETQQAPSFTMNQLLAITGIHSPLLYRNCLTLHCSYILHRGRAILFAAPSGTGKSTQAALWEKYRGAEIINGDRALLFRRGGQWFAGGISVCGSSNICKNKTAPLLAVVLLEQGAENRVLPCTAGEKFRALLGGSAYHRWSREELELVSDLCLQAAEGVPMLRLHCRPDGDAVDTLERALEGIYEL